MSSIHLPRKLEAEWPWIKRPHSLIRRMAVWWCRGWIRLAASTVTVTNTQRGKRFKLAQNDEISWHFSFFGSHDSNFLFKTNGSIHGVWATIHWRFISKNIISPLRAGQLSFSLSRRKLQSINKSVAHSYAEQSTAPVLIHQPDQWMALALKLLPKMFEMMKMKA